jgi:hypothetical protein
MQSTRVDAQGGLDSFIGEFAGLDDVTIELIDFDEKIRVAVPAVVASAWPGYTLTPRGSTALLDAMAKGVKTTREYVKNHTPERSVLVIITDGGENASRKHTLAEVTELIDGLKGDGTELVFLASDLSAINTAHSSGIAMASTHSFAPTATRSAYSRLASSVASYTTGSTATVEWDSVESE